MSEIFFNSFKRIHGALRGSGLGKIKMLRDIRDAVYRTLRPSSPRVVQLPDFKLWVDPATAGGVVPGLLLDGIHEPSETRCIRDHLPRGGTFLDIGANIGYYTVLAAQAVGPEGRVYAFEPESLNYSTLKKNIELNGLNNVTAEMLGCSDRNAEIAFYIDRNNAGGHHLHDTHDGSEATTIRTIVLDEYLEAHDRSIDLIKMDIQGHEPVALRGMRRVLQRHPEVNIITEFDGPMIQAAGESPEGYLNELRALGYRFTILSDFDASVENADTRDIMSRCRNGEYVNLFCEK